MMMMKFYGKCNQALLFLQNAKMENISKMEKCVSEGVFQRWELLG